MAKQLNLQGLGQVIPTALHTEMQQSYLEYAMSVIVGRALPDVRDGLKPVHRRILYAMHELGLTPDRPYRKCARVVGDVLGKYHPHGDQAVYDALVRMVQNFSTRYPLLDGHGNFGSVDNDPPAAMRYTETRLARISHEALLSEIGEATVDFIGNFDNSQQEPVVLPAQLPVLLLNGCAGIAVGMATNVPPHNLNEVVDGLVALIDNPNLPDDQLWQLIPGPDFPTGGEIIGTEGIREAYSTGRGSILVRGIANFEEIQGGRGKHRRMAIVVTELPFQVNKAGWIEKVAELVNQGRIEGIAELRDESDREGMRVVIELKRDTNQQQILDQLYKQTALSTNFGAILLALVNGQPRQLTLRQLLQEFLSFREQTLTRQYTYELEQAQRRVHLLEGLLAALSQLDAVIEILRNAPDGTIAKRTFQERFNFSDQQADAILAMPLRRLTGLEQQNLQTEFDQLSERIRQLQKLLSDRRELLKALKKDLRSLKKKYGDPRRTQIRTETKGLLAKRPEGWTEEQRSKGVREALPSQKSKVKSQNSDLSSSPNSFSLPLEIPEEQVILEFTLRGYVRRIPKDASQHSKSRNQNSKSNDDLVIKTQLSNTQAELIVLLGSGKAYPIKVRDIPPTLFHTKRGANAHGVPLLSLLPESVQGSSETIMASFALPNDPEKADLVLLTQLGRIKRLPISELTNLTNRGITLIKLKDKDQLQYACITREGEQLVLATSGGRLLRLEIKDEQLPIMGRTAQGLQAMRLRRSEQLVGALTLDGDGSLLLISQLGYAKRLPVGSVRLANLGDLGTQALQFSSKTDALAAMLPAVEKSEVIVMTSTQQMMQVPMKSVAFWGKDGTGDQVVQLSPDEKILSITVHAR